MATSETNTGKDSEPDDSISPDGKYERLKEKLGEGAFKQVYKAVDTEEGVTVAWNEVDIQALPKTEKKRVIEEVKILQQVEHSRVMKYVKSWYEPTTHRVVIITEILTEGTLKHFTQRVKTMRLRMVRKWSRQILEGLAYLHNLNPPIIHRDLKCDNIFINEKGDIKIGDLGLSKRSGKGEQTKTVLGTPEFMAPELYTETYDETVDIYAFGLALLEMVGKETPYSECMNIGQIITKVSAGKTPALLNRVTHAGLREFIFYCITKSKAGKRPSAMDCLKHPFLDLENDDGDLAALVAQIEEGREEVEMPVNNTENKIVDAENNKPKLGKVASSTNEDERSNLQNVKQDKEVANEMKEEEIRTTKTYKKVDEPIEGSNANNKGVGIVSNKTKENTKKYIGQEDQAPNKQAEQVYLEKNPVSSVGKKQDASGLDHNSAKVEAEADDMAEMQREFRQSREDEAIKKLQELPQDDQYFSQLNTNDGEEKSNTQRSGKNGNNNSDSDGNEGKMKDSPPPKKEEKSEGGVTLSYQRGEERQGVRKVKLVLRRHYGDNGQLKSNGKTKTPVIKFEFDLHKDDPYTLASEMTNQKFLSEYELIRVASKLATLQVKHRYTYAMTQQLDQNINIFTDLATPESFPVHVKPKMNSPTNSSGNTVNTNESGSNGKAQVVKSTVNNLESKQNGESSTQISNVGSRKASNSIENVGITNSNETVRGEELKVKQKRESMEKNYVCVSQDLLSLQQMLKELEALAAEKDTEASAIKDLKEEEMRNCDNDLLEAALKKELFILNEYTKVLGQTLAEIEEKQENCSVIQRRIESLDNGMNNLDIDDREDENDRRKIQSLRDQLAKDTEERKLVLKQMESQQHHATTKSSVSIPAPINEDVDDRPKIQKHEDIVMGGEVNSHISGRSASGSLDKSKKDNSDSGTRQNLAKSLPETEITSNILPDERVTGAASTALDNYTKQVLEDTIKDKASVESDRSGYNKMKEGLKDGTKIEDVNTGIASDKSTTGINASQEDSDFNQSAKRNGADISENIENATAGT